MRCTAASGRRTRRRFASSASPRRTSYRRAASWARGACARRSKRRLRSSAREASGRSSPSCRRGSPPLRGRARRGPRSRRSAGEPARIPGARDPPAPRHSHARGRRGREPRGGTRHRRSPGGGPEGRGESPGGRRPARAKPGRANWRAGHPGPAAPGAGPSAEGARVCRALRVWSPVGTSPDGAVVALDAKIVVDDNELERRPEIAALRDATVEAPSEVAARKAGLTFIKLEGTVGCCVNGAGLAMATMDLVKYYGGEPANFLDIGGSSNPQKVVTALQIITADPSVRAILFNIFGGITRCDDVANGIVQATRQFPLKVPLVIRLTGTNEELAVQILTQAGFPALTDMDEAVKQAVAKAEAA